MSSSSESTAPPKPLLVVDDEELNRDVLRRRLQRRGYTVETAASGAEALEFVGASPPDLIFLDIMMPEMDGIEVLERLRTEFSAQELPIIMVTARDDSAAIVDSLGRGANDYITKPIDMPVLLARLETALLAKRAEESLVLAREAAEEASRTKSQFLANMSHELRTPLNSIIGFSQVLLKTATGLNEQQNTFVERIHDNGNHLLQLINDILDLSKIEAGHLELTIEPVDLASLITETVTQMEGRVLDSDIQLLVELADGLAPVDSDSAKLKQALINLIGNAIKFTEQGSVTVTLLQEGPQPRIEIRDTGIGIPEDKLETIFESFRQADDTTSRRFGGTGLGLPISRQLLQLMGHDIEVSSEVGVGSIFTILLKPESHRAAP